MGKGNGYRASKTKSSRARHKDSGLALKHKISRLKDYVRRHPTDLQAKSNLDKMIN